VTAVTTKPEPLALVERVQTLLAQTDAPFAKLEQGLLEIERIMASNDADLEEIGSRRKIEMTAATPAGELDKKLDALDKRKKEIERRTEIASIVRVELETRIATEREAERADKQLANYAAALKLHAAATNLVREFLDKFGPEARRVLREYAESELKTASANSDLPAGAVPIRSIEAERRGQLRSPETKAREFKAFVDGRRFIGEQGHVQAAERKDGKWDVYLPAGSTGAGDYFVCELVAYVEVETETDATPWPEFLATTLSCPAFSIAKHPAWRPIPADNLGPPDQILIELDKLESLPPPQFGPRVENRTMSLATWRRLNGETLDADPPRAQLAAE
jgi:hypothetical protein